MPADLTVKQKQLLDYLQQHIHRQGQAPSLRQAASHLGISHAAVAQTLRLLQEKGYLRREGRYSRTIHLLNQTRETAALQRWREVPLIGRVTAGLPMYAQQQWDGTVVVDDQMFGSRNLFALRVSGDSMRNASILNGDLALCEPRQYARNGEIVVALINEEEATVKRFFLKSEHIELHPENPAFEIMHYGFDQVLIQGKVVGILRGPDGMARIDAPSDPGKAGR